MSLIRQLRELQDEHKSMKLEGGKDEHTKWARKSLRTKQLDEEIDIYENAEAIRRSIELLEDGIALILSDG